jgi:hypothetical protein
MSLEATTLMNGDIVTSISSTTTLNSNIIGNNSLDAVINTTSPQVGQHDSNNDDPLELTILCIKGIIFVTIILGAVLGMTSKHLKQLNGYLNMLTSFQGMHLLSFQFIKTEN